MEVNWSPRENPHKHEENLQTPFRETQLEFKLGAFRKLPGWLKSTQSSSLLLMMMSLFYSTNSAFWFQQLNPTKVINTQYIILWCWCWPTSGRHNFSPSAGWDAVINNYDMKTVLLQMTVKQRCPDSFSLLSRAPPVLEVTVEVQYRTYRTDGAYGSKVT